MSKQSKFSKAGNKPSSIREKKIRVPVFGWLAGILLLILFLYSGIGGNGFTNWDDPDYLLNNPLISRLTPGNLHSIFAHYYFGNYQPLLLMIYSVGHAIWGLNPAGYHWISLFVHLCNTVLLFYVIRMLSGNTVSLLTALLFGIHPIHVEPVAWAAGLKDPLFTLFYLSSYLCYLNYQDKGRPYCYYLSLFLFAFSLLSKATAATLPVLFVLTDYFKEKKLNAGAWLRKLPFFILSLVFLVIAYYGQRQVGGINIPGISLPQRMILLCVAVIRYLTLLIWPGSFSAFYPYPLEPGQAIPVLFYFYLFLLFVIAFLVYYSLRFTKVIFFGAGFFIITIFMTLQLVPVGNAFMADRFAYLPSAGILFLAAEGIYLVDHKYSRAASILLLALFTVFLSGMTYAYCKTWKDGLTLWDNVIHHEQATDIAFYNRAEMLESLGKTQEALADYSKAIELNPRMAAAYCNRGVLLMQQNKYDDALTDFSAAIRLQDNLPEAYCSRGNILTYKNKNQEAITDFTKAIKLKPDFTEAYFGRGTAFMNLQKYDSSVVDFSKSIELTPASQQAYLSRGTVLTVMLKFREALPDFNKAIELNPSSPEAFIKRAVYYVNVKNYNEAIQDYTSAISLQPAMAESYYERGVIRYNTGRKSDACADMEQAARLGFAKAADAFNRFCQEKN